METKKILQTTPRVVDQYKREEYFQKGFVTLENIIPANWLAKLSACSESLLNDSRVIQESNDAYDLGPNHSR